MDFDEAEKWCRDHKFDFMYYKYPDDSGHPGDPNKGISTRPASPGKEGWWVAGWRFPSDPHKDKTRIHEVGGTLQEAVERAKAKYYSS